MAKKFRVVAYHTDPQAHGELYRTRLVDDVKVASGSTQGGLQIEVGAGKTTLIVNLRAVEAVEVTGVNEAAEGD